MSDIIINIPEDESEIPTPSFSTYWYFLDLEVSELKIIFEQNRN